jgi:hypothetical protein
MRFDICSHPFANDRELRELLPVRTLQAASICAVLCFQCVKKFLAPERCHM